MQENAHSLLKPLTESVVLITGGTSGVGLAAALKFAQAGVRKLALVGRDSARGSRAKQAVLAAHADADVFFIAADGNVATEAARVCEAVHGRFGSLDVLVNSTVGDAAPMLLHQIPLEGMEKILLAQMMAPLLMSRAALPFMQQQHAGCIINVSSDAGKLATPGESVIGAAMAGIVMFSRTMAMEAKRDGIRVNVLTPSLIEGTLTHARMQQDPFATKLFAKAKQAASLGVVVADDMADFIVFLASPQAARVTGQAISINGGISAA